MGQYTEMSNQLDGLIDELRSGELDLDEAIQKHDQAKKLIVKMEQYLITAKNKITKVKLDLDK